MQEFREHLKTLKDKNIYHFGKIFQLRDDIKQVMASLGTSVLNEYDNQLGNRTTMKSTRHNIEKNAERIYFPSYTVNTFNEDILICTKMNHAT
jgi:uncharacterized protein YdcH (DUF465 family)